MSSIIERSEGLPKVSIEFGDEFILELKHGDCITGKFIVQPHRAHIEGLKCTSLELRSYPVE